LKLSRKKERRKCQYEKRERDRDRERQREKEIERKKGKERDNYRDSILSRREREIKERVEEEKINPRETYHFWEREVSQTKEEKNLHQTAFQFFFLRRTFAEQSKVFILKKSKESWRGTEFSVLRMSV
jgi:hypothetical protein